MKNCDYFKKKQKKFGCIRIFRIYLQNNQTYMGFEIIEHEELSGDKAHIYSVVLTGEENSLLEQFFDECAPYQEEVQKIVQKIYVMGHNTGCRWDYFKHNEGRPGDGVCALRYGRLRLYCLYFDNTAVFFGSGGFKPEAIRAYQEDEHLNAKAEQMKNIAARINQAIIDKDIIINEEGILTTNNWDND